MVWSESAVFDFWDWHGMEAWGRHSRLEGGVNGISRIKSGVLVTIESVEMRLWTWMRSILDDIIEIVAGTAGNLLRWVSKGAKKKIDRLMVGGSKNVDTFTFHSYTERSSDRFCYLTFLDPFTSLERTGRRPAVFANLSNITMAECKVCTFYLMTRVDW